MNDIVRIPLSELTDGNEVNFRQPRTRYDKNKIKELAESIILHGMKNPVQVWRTTQAGVTYNVRIGGGRRCAALKHLIDTGRHNEGKAKGLVDGVPCNIIESEVDIKKAFAEAVVDNIQREDMTTFEQAEAVWFMSRDGMKGNEIAEALSKSNAWVSRNMACYREATGEVRAAWRDEKITFDNVSDLIKNFDMAEDMNNALTKIVELRASGKRSDNNEAKQIAKNKEGEAPKPPKSEKLTAAQIKMYLEQAAGPHPAKFRYAQGVHDGLALAVGQVGILDLEEDYAEFLKYKKAKENQKKAITETLPETQTEDAAKA